MRTGMSKVMCVSLSPTSTTLLTVTSEALAIANARATCAAVGHSLELYSSNRPSAGTDMAVTFGGNVMLASPAAKVRLVGKKVAVLLTAAAPVAKVALDRAVTLIAARTASPPLPVALIVRTMLIGSIATTGMPAGGTIVPPALTGIESPVNAYVVLSMPVPSRSTTSVIVPVCAALALAASPNSTTCVAVPIPSTLTTGAPAPPSIMTMPYASPV